MFQFPSCPSSYEDDRLLHLPGCPIRRSVDHSLLAAPYGVSSLGTSFLGTSPLGILQKPFVALNYSTHSRIVHPPRLPSLRLFFERVMPNQIANVCYLKLYTMLQRCPKPLYLYRMSLYSVLKVLRLAPLPCWNTMVSQHEILLKDRLQWFCFTRNLSTLLRLTRVYYTPGLRFCQGLFSNFFLSGGG